MTKPTLLFTLLVISLLTSCNKTQDSTKITTTDTVRENTTKTVPNSDNKTEPQTCIDIAMEILASSPVYIQKTDGLYDAVVKNGGTSYGVTIEGSPNPDEDRALAYSATYDFNLHETYPDRMPTIARFTFNPTEGQLYEYDVVEDTLNPIGFDKNKLLKFNQICKK